MAAMVDEMDVDNGDGVELKNDAIITKYKTASDIANKTLGGILQYSKAGMKVIDVCAFGDSLIVQQTANLYKKKKTEKGIAFPTCLSVNEIVCHYSPLTSDNSIVLKEGDLVKVDLGVHIDGYIAVCAHTFVVQGQNPQPVTGRMADVIKAAWTGADAAVKLIKPGAKNKDITDMLQKVGEDFDVNPLQGVLMHELKQFIIDGNNVIIGKEGVDQKVDTFEFDELKVYTVDVCMSTGSGKPIERDLRTTVYKRSVDREHGLKMKASRYVLSEVSKNFSTFPFSLRAIKDERQARLGIVECVKNELLTTYPVLSEKQGDFVAHFKFTVLLLPSGTVKVTGLPCNPDEWQSDKVISDEVKAILALSTKKPKKNKKKSADAMDTE